MIISLRSTMEVLNSYLKWIFFTTRGLCKLFNSRSLTFHTYALLMNPLASAIEELFPAKVARSNWCFITLRIALVASSVCIALSIPFFGIDQLNYSVFTIISQPH